MEMLPGGCNIMAIPYRTFKERIRLVKEYEKSYKIEILEQNYKEGVLYMIKRGAKQ